MTWPSWNTSAMSDRGRSRATMFAAFLALVTLSFILRIWYAGNLYQDDGLWFTAAEEILRGKALYRDFFFDKPPALPLLYAGIFKIFGAHILTIRLFTICYSVVISSVLYFSAKQLYNKWFGLVAAIMFAVFSTTYISGDMQSLNTELLMTPFYASGAMLMIGATLARRRTGWLAFGGGAMAGVAFQCNPKGAYDLIFLVLLLIVARAWHKAPANDYVRAGFKLLAMSLAGFVCACLPFLLFISATGAFSRYKLYVWDWGLEYARYYSASRGMEIFLHYGTDYFLINNTLLVLLIVAVGMVTRRLIKAAGARPSSRPEKEQTAEQEIDTRFARTDIALLIWFGISFAAVATGGRFFAHYYFQVIPSLCLIGARGLGIIGGWLNTRTRLLKAVVTVVLTAGFSYTLARSHSDTAALASDWFRGRNGMANRATRTAAAIVREIPDPNEAATRAGSEAFRKDGPRTRAADGAADYLFIWGNWPEVYYLSGLLPASGYLSSQPLTGIPADVWYGSEPYRVILDQSAASAAREELARELQRTPPKYIIDELAFRDARLSIENYSELHGIMRDYETFGSAVGAPIYIRKSER